MLWHSCSTKKLLKCVKKGIEYQYLELFMTHEQLNIKYFIQLAYYLRKHNPPNRLKCLSIYENSIFCCKAQFLTPSMSDIKKLRENILNLLSKNTHKYIIFGKLPDGKEFQKKIGISLKYLNII